MYQIKDKVVVSLNALIIITIMGVIYMNFEFYVFINLYVIHVYGTTKNLSTYVLYKFE